MEKHKEQGRINMKGEVKISTIIIFMIVFGAVLSMCYTFYGSTMILSGQTPKSIGTISTRISITTNQWTKNMTSKIGNETSTNPTSGIFAAFNVFLSTAVGMVDVFLGLPGLIVDTTNEINNVAGFPIPPEFINMIMAIVILSILFAIIKFRGGRNEI